MSDQAKYTVTLEFQSEGADKEVNNLRELQRGIDEVADSQGISRKSQENLSRANHRSEQSARAAAGGMDELGTATGTANENTRQINGSLPTLRYALYDVAQTAGAAAAAIGALGASTLVASASFESSFTAVERTSGLMGAEASALREELVALTRQIPQSFAEIANIAARGAQLGIASDQISDFTDTVAQFVATSDTVSLDQAVEAFGRISNLLGDTDFNRIGSAITLVGVNAAATEAQIVKTTQELAPFATAVGMSTDEVIALAAALGSLGQPPERARSAFLTLQRVMDNAIASGSENLSAFAQLLGQTEQEVASLWKQDPGQFVEAFAGALGGVEDLTTAFADLGINERRAVQVFQALAADSRNAGDGLSVLNKAMSDAAQGYAEGTELGRQYALIVDDLASSWQFFLNSIQEFAAAVGDVLAPAAQQILDFVTEVIQGLTEVAETPFGGFVVTLVAALGGLAFVVLSVVATMALFTASMVAGSTALKELNAVAGASIFTLQGLRNAFGQVAVASGLSTTALRNFRIALAATGIGVAVLAVGALAAAFLDLRESALWTIDSFEWLFQNIQSWTSGIKPLIGVLFGIMEAFGGVNTAVLASAFTLENFAKFTSRAAQALTLPFLAIVASIKVAVDAIQQWARVMSLVLGSVSRTAGSALGGIANAFASLGNTISRFITGFQNGVASFDNFSSSIFDGLRNLAMQLPTATSGMEDFGGALDYAGGFLPDFDNNLSSMSDNLGGVGDSAKNAAKEVRTLIDYADDLASIWDRAFEIRFSGETTQDAITRTFMDMREAAEAAQKRIRDLRTEILGMRASISQLESDISIQEYFLSIAVEYGDTQRAAAIEADLAVKRAELAERTDTLSDKNKELKREQDATSTSLTGNSRAAIENRDQMRQLVQQYQAHLRALAASGMGSDELARKTEQLRQDFIRQATQLGYSRTELGRYEKSFDDVRVAIAKIPRNITVKANANPAIQAINEFRSRLVAANNMVNTLRNNAAKGVPAFATPSVNTYGDRQRALRTEIAAQDAWVKRLIASGNASGALAASDRLLRLREQLRWGNFWTGGFTGTGGKYEPKGIVHGGEYVIPKRDVNQATGLPYADALGRLMGGIAVRGSSGGSSGGSSSMGVQQVALTAGTIQAIAQATGKAIYLDGAKIAEASSRSYAHGFTVGAH